MRTKKSFVLIMVLPILLTSHGCAKRIDVEAEKENIRAAIEKTADAIQHQDWETLKGLISDDWEHFSHIGERWDMEAMKKFFQDHITDHKIEFSDIEIHISDDGTMAWAKFNEQTEYKFDGNPVKENAIFTAIFEKKNSDWVMVLLHRSAPPPSAPPTN